MRESPRARARARVHALLYSIGGRVAMFSPLFLYKFIPLLTLGDTDCQSAITIAIYRQFYGSIDRQFPGRIVLLVLNAERRAGRGGAR